MVAVLLVATLGVAASALACPPRFLRDRAPPEPALLEPPPPPAWPGQLGAGVIFGSMVLAARRWRRRGPGTAAL